MIVWMRFNTLVMSRHVLRVWVKSLSTFAVLLIGNCLNNDLISSIHVLLKPKMHFKLNQSDT